MLQLLHDLVVPDLFTRYGASGYPALAEAIAHALRSVCAQQVDAARLAQHARGEGTGDAAQHEWLRTCTGTRRMLAALVGHQEWPPLYTDLDRASAREPLAESAHAMVDLTADV